MKPPVITIVLLALVIGSMVSDSGDILTLLIWWVGIGIVLVLLHFVDCFILRRLAKARDKRTAHQ